MKKKTHPMRDAQGRWLTSLPHGLVYQIIQEERIDSRMHADADVVDSDADDVNIEWVLCDYPLQFVNVPLGLMEAERVSSYRKADPKTRPPVILGPKSKWGDVMLHEIWQGRHRIISAFLTGASSILAYVPQLHDGSDEDIERFRIYPKNARSRHAA